MAKETTSIDPFRAQLVGISLSVARACAAYIPVGHCYAGAPEQLPVDLVLERLKPWLEDATRAKVSHDAKYDIHVLANFGQIRDGRPRAFALHLRPARVDRVHLALVAGLPQEAQRSPAVLRGIVGRADDRHAARREQELRERAARRRAVHSSVRWMERISLP